MSLSLGSTTIGSLYLGSTKVGEAYLGNVKVYESAPPDPHSVVIGGKRYPTVTMPDGNEWMAMNLDYAWSNLTVCTSTVYANNSTAYAAYYGTDEATYGWNGLKYGLLYNWKAANYLNANRSTLCPGWHVPSNQELQDLKTAVGGNANSLRNNDGWYNSNGTNDYGFTMSPSGFWDQSSSTFKQLTYDGFLYAYDQYSSSIGYSFDVNQGGSILTNTINKKSYCSIRLVKDST